MSAHASTASITLGGSAPTTPQPQQQHYPNEPTQTASQPDQGHRRRRRPNVPDHMQASHGQPVAQPVSKPKYGGAMPFGTVYASKGPIQSSTPDQAFQTQTLFKDQPQVHTTQQGGVRIIERPVAPAPYVPGPKELSSRDEERAAEARAKLKEMNISADLVEQYRRRFNVLDLNKDGVVNLREFAAISRVLGYKFSKEEVLVSYAKHLTINS